MYKSIHADIKIYNLDNRLYHLHKEGVEQSDFGMDSSNELLEGSFGLYSSKDLRKSIGPVKTEYYRIGFVKSGKVKIDLGLERFQPGAYSMIFGFPGQVFSLYDQSPDFFCYYMLFKESFLADGSAIKYSRIQVPFFGYSGIQSFRLDEKEAAEVEQLILKINDELKNKRTGTKQVIQLYIDLIILQAKRCYPPDLNTNNETAAGDSHLFKRYVRLVNEHFLTLHKVAAYAALLNVSSDHLNRVVKNQCGKTAHELIDEMILTESKAWLKHSKLSISEIAWKLEFSDPSNFSKFFKKHTGATAQEFRDKSD